MTTKLIRLLKRSYRKHINLKKCFLMKQKRILWHNKLKDMIKSHFKERKKIRKGVREKLTKKCLIR